MTLNRFLQFIAIGVCMWAGIIQSAMAVFG